MFFIFSENDFVMRFLIPLVVVVFVGCQSETMPEEVLKEWLTLVQNGECKKAQELEIETSMNIVIPDCEPFKREIKAINCKTESETSLCNCTEIRNGEVPTDYTYKLKKVDGEWQLYIPNEN